MWGPMFDSSSCHCSHYAGPISDSSGFNVGIMRSLTVLVVTVYIMWGPMSDSSSCHCSHNARTYSSSCHCRHYVGPYV